MSNTIYVDETMVDIANNMYALSSELADAQMKYEQAMDFLEQNYINEETKTNFEKLRSLFVKNIAKLVELYSKYSDYIWFVLSSMLEHDDQLASKILDRMKNSLATDEEE